MRSDQRISLQLSQDMETSDAVMKVTVVFVRVVTKAEYDHGACRWLDSYKEYVWGYEHSLAVVNRYAESPDSLFDDFATYYLRYDSGGWDCGTWQFVANHIETDLLVCFNSSTYVTGDNWLKRFVDAVKENGEGLYGPLTSYEVVPHVRTPCMIFQPKVIRDYPRKVETREDTWRFESLGWPDGTPNVTQWAMQQGFPARLITWDGVYDLADWRKPENIFRRGDQSNLIVKDRHCEAYSASDEEGKRTLERLADGQ